MYKTFIVDIFCKNVCPSRINRVKLLHFPLNDVMRMDCSKTDLRLSAKLFEHILPLPC